MKAFLHKMLAFVMLSCCCRVAATAQELPTGAESFPKVPAIVLKDLTDKNTLLRFDSSALHVLVFLSPECPLCKNYSLVLNRLAAKFAGSVAVYGIVPGRTYTKRDIEQFVSDYKLQFPVLFDRNKELANYLKASVTPEVLVINRPGNVIYRGAIDDWVQSLGKKKTKPEKHYLEDALTGYLQDKAILVKKTTPIGCLINEF